MSDSLSSIWGHSVHFAEIPVLRFQKATDPTVFFYSISTKLFLANSPDNMSTERQGPWASCFQSLCCFYLTRSAV